MMLTRSLRPRDVVKHRARMLATLPRSFEVGTRHMRTSPRWLKSQEAFPKLDTEQRSKFIQLPAMADWSGYTAKVASREELLAVRCWTHSKAGLAEEPTEDLMGKSVASLIEMYSNMTIQQKKHLVDDITKNGLDTFLEKLANHQKAQFDDPDAAEKLKNAYLAAGLREYIAEWQKEIEATQSTEDAELAKKEDEEAKAAANRSTAKGGSRTANLTCQWRHVAAVCGFGPDNLARHFVDDPDGALWTQIKEGFEKDGSMPGIMGRAGREKQRKSQAETPWKLLDGIAFLQTRTCFGDDAIVQWIEDYPDGSNVIILGAGYDTRFYRLSLPETAQLYEVDAAGTQDEKLKKIKACGVELPNQSRVKYVTVDFQKESWMERLVANGMKKDLPTFIAWEGVIYYLPQDVAEASLKTVATEFQGPTAIFFDYFHPKLVEEGREQFINEPWIFGVTPEDLIALLHKIGLQEIDHLSTNEGLDRYYPKAADGENLGVGSDLKQYIIAACRR